MENSQFPFRYEAWISQAPPSEDQPRIIPEINQKLRGNYTEDARINWTK